jgi:hypothetical protein
MTIKQAFNWASFYTAALYVVVVSTVTAPFERKR